MTTAPTASPRQREPQLLGQTVVVIGGSAGKVRPGGALVFMGGTGGRGPSLGVGITSAMTAAA